ncbi:MAG TPA: hypothetical protein VKR82_09870 [Candidatus Acidoferrales bacterium]|nr:hypothetical protein [Candidatus Acidoferrales bacterium]
MRFALGALALILLIAESTAAQRLPPGIWFSSPSPDGASADARFEVETGPTGTMLHWAPFGKSPVSWGPVALAQDGSIEFRWEANPPLSCALRRADERNYEGMCRGSGQIDLRLTLSRNQSPNGLELPVSETDFQILAQAQKILWGPSAWNRHDERYCDNAAKQNSWSLFCALYQASFAVEGKYVHLRPVMEEVRAAVSEVNGRTLNHQLMDYNNLESTQYADIKAVFEQSEKRLQTRKACAESPGSNWTMDGRSDPNPKRRAPPQSGDVPSWGEGLNYTVDKKTYRLREILGPMANNSEVPEDWLAASTSVARRRWEHDRLEGVDGRGKLSNGNQWRYFSLCGESWSYYDVPAEAAAFFDRVIDGAYSDGGHR